MAAKTPPPERKINSKAALEIVLARCQAFYERNGRGRVPGVNQNILAMHHCQEAIAALADLEHDCRVNDVLENEHMHVDPVPAKVQAKLQAA